MVSWTRAREYVEDRLHIGRRTLLAKKPHFNFITAHYVWIVAATIIASIMIYAAAKGDMDYIDALLFASGANTQAGLNPIDVNDLNTFQQIVMYIFPMLSNPITLHGSVVILRLYWFEKRFQGLVRDVRQRRTTISKSRSKARTEDQRAEEGVNGRNITVIAPTAQNSPKLANDGTMLGSEEKVQPKPAGTDSETAVTDDRPNSVELGHMPHMPHGQMDTPPAFDDVPTGNETEPRTPAQGTGGQTAIKFAPAVKRSDDVEDDIVNFARGRSNVDHIAILERQRNQDDEVLRIPGPRDAELGLGPRCLSDGDPQYEDENTLYTAKTRDSRPEGANGTAKATRPNPTITIEEPSRRKRDEVREEVAQDAKAVGGTLDSLRLRKPRALNRNQSKLHEDSETKSNRATRTKTLDTLRSALSRDKTDDMPYLSYTPTMGRNSNFVGLTLEQREELGGIEYRSLRTLALVLLGYFWGFQLLALIFLLPFILHDRHYGRIVAEAGVARSWWGFWTANVSFMDVGFTLTPDSMISFKTSEYALMVMWFFIIIGNTGFPVMLRFVIWVMSKITPRGSGLWEELRFLLDHPRRCFTLLFPSGANWWLFWILVILNAVDLLFYIILDAASTRTAGFSCVPLADLHPAMPVLYLLMMYISVFPIAISIRRTNVYEEKSLGVYYDKRDVDDDNQADANALSYVGTHLRRQLSFDLWYLFLGFFVLTISEGSKIKEGRFNSFDVLFEIVSAYGTVGLSMGVAGIDASLCSQFSVVGKLIIIAMEIRGRHRGLPYGLDRAVILPSESRLRNETKVVDAPLARATTQASAAPTARTRRGSSTQRGRSMSRERDRRIITRFLHPGPVVPPGLVHSHSRNMSTDSRDRDLSRVHTSGSRHTPSVFAEMDNLMAAGGRGDDAYSHDEGSDLGRMRTADSRPVPPRRADTTPGFWSHA